MVYTCLQATFIVHNTCTTESKINEINERRDGTIQKIVSKMECSYEMMYSYRLRVYNVQYIVIYVCVCLAFAMIHVIVSKVIRINH